MRRATALASGNSACSHVDLHLLLDPPPTQPGTTEAPVDIATQRRINTQSDGRMNHATDDVDAAPVIEKVVSGLVDLTAGVTGKHGVHGQHGMFGKQGTEAIEKNGLHGECAALGKSGSESVAIVAKHGVLGQCGALGKSGSESLATVAKHGIHVHAEHGIFGKLASEGFKIIALAYLLSVVFPFIEKMMGLR